MSSLKSISLVLILKNKKKKNEENISFFPCIEHLRNANNWFTCLQQLFLTHENKNSERWIHVKGHNFWKWFNLTSSNYIYILDVYMFYISFYSFFVRKKILFSPYILAFFFDKNGIDILFGLSIILFIKFISIIKCSLKMHTCIEQSRFSLWAYIIT